MVGDRSETSSSGAVRGCIALLMLVFLLAPGSAGANDPQPHITDIAGDANTDLVEADTSPASYDPADILSVRFETEYVAIPVGDDGIDHEPTALVVHYATLAPPSSDATTISWDVTAEIGGCLSRLRVADRGIVGFPLDPDEGMLTWAQFEETCPDTAGEPAWSPFWSATLDESSGGWKWRIPLDSLTPSQADVLAPGATISAAWAATRTYGLLTATNLPGDITLWRIDKTGTGTDFVIGEDVPPDVPCTQGCPAP